MAVLWLTLVPVRVEVVFAVDMKPPPLAATLESIVPPLAVNTTGRSGPVPVGVTSASPPPFDAAELPLMAALVALTVGVSPGRSGVT